MAIFPTTHRRLVPELMDAPSLAPHLHEEALAGLRRLNTASSAAIIIARPILALAARHNLTTLSLLDVACGGADVPLAVAHLARSQNLHLDLTLTDKSTTALSLAASAAQSANIPARTVEGHVPDALPQGPFDIVTNSLFLHHLTRDEVIASLAAMAQRTSRLLVISDLRRSLIGWAIAWSAARLLSTSKIVHYDAPVSVRAAWTIPELRAMATAAGLHSATIRPVWPWRMLLTWQPPPSAAGVPYAP